MKEETRTLAYLCPHCRQSVIAERTVFALSAAPLEIPCPCGKSCLRVECMGDRYRLTVPCAFCGGEHTVSCPAQPFLKERALAFSCGASSLDCCYVGEEGPVFAAMRRLEEAEGKLAEGEKGEGAFLDDLVMSEVLSELKEIAQRGGISCTCGCHQWKLRISYSAIDLICPRCGGAMRIPAATSSDIDDICCKTRLQIKGKG